MRDNCALALNDKVPVCTITDLKYGWSQRQSCTVQHHYTPGGGGGTAYVTPGLRLTRLTADRKERRARYCHTVADCIVLTATIVRSVFFRYDYSKDITVFASVVMVTTMAVLSVLL